MGIAIGPDERTPELVQAEMHALPPVEDAVPLLEALVARARA